MLLGFDAVGHLIEPFFTTRTIGNGLGLATTRDIVSEHGGAMHVASVVDIGIRFEVWQPCLSSVPSGENAPPSFGDGETVLLTQTSELSA